MGDDDWDPEERRIVTAMLVGAVGGAAYGWVFLQDTIAGVVGGIAVGTILAMVFPERTDDALQRLDEALE